MNIGQGQGIYFTKKDIIPTTKQSEFYVNNSAVLLNTTPNLVFTIPNTLTITTRVFYLITHVVTSNPPNNNVFFTMRVNGINISIPTTLANDFIGGNQFDTITYQNSIIINAGDLVQIFGQKINANIVNCTFSRVTLHF